MWRKNGIDHSAVLHRGFFNGDCDSFAHHLNVVLNNLDRDFGVRLLSAFHANRRFHLVAVRDELCGLLGKTLLVADVDCCGQANLENGRLNACALIENIAQTCAARMGYINHYIYKKEVQLGFIGSVKNLIVKRVPLLGETLTTSIKVMEEIMQLTLVQAEIKVGEESIVTAEMKIALSEKTVK